MIVQPQFPLPGPVAGTALRETGTGHGCDRMDGSAGAGRGRVRARRPTADGGAPVAAVRAAPGRPPPEAFGRGTHPRLTLRQEANDTRRTSPGGPPGTSVQPRVESCADQAWPSTVTLAIPRPVARVSNQSAIAQGRAVSSPWTSNRPGAERSTVSCGPNAAPRASETVSASPASG